MDLRVEWDAEGVGRIFEDPENHLHPFAPDFSRWIEVLGRRGEVHGSVAELPGASGGSCPQRASARPRRARLDRPATGGGSWGSTTAARGTSVVRGGDRRAASHGRGAGGRRDRAATDGGDPPVHRAAVPIDGRARPRRHVHRRGGRARGDHLHEPADRGDARLHAEEWLADPEMWPRTMHPDDRARALAENVRHNETGEPFGLEYRMFAKDGRVVWVLDEATMVRDEHGCRSLLPRRAAGHHRPEAPRGARRVPGVPRRADRPAVPGDVRGAARACRSRGRERHDGAVAVALRRPRRFPRWSTTRSGTRRATSS